MFSNVNQKAALALTDEDLAEIESNLRQQYRGVFDEKLIALHIREFVESGFADRMASVISRQLPKGASVLDVGCGYGAFVLAGRTYGLDVTGLELAPFEVEIARRRLGRAEPGTDTSKVILQGSAEHMPFADGQFDAVTLFNVLEHVRDHLAVLREAVRVMRPGARMYIVCPNYAALRQEAHYHVPWLPLLPRSLAVIYLRILGRNPIFFQEHIHYRTNWGILAALRSMDLRLFSLDILRIEYPELISSRRMKSLYNLLARLRLLPLVRMLLAANLYNPIKAAVSVVAIKGEAS